MPLKLEAKTAAAKKKIKFQDGFCDLTLFIETLSGR